MKQALLFSFLLYLLPITTSAQTIAQKLPAKHKQETIYHCGSRSIWLKGHWQWDKSQQEYFWIQGQCVPHKKGHTYIPGRWIKVADGWKWQDGTWKKI